MLIRKEVKNRDTVFESTIHCPYCNWEYMLADIIIPKYFFATAFEVERDEKGQIINKIGYVKPVHKWEFTCENCNRDFIVRANPYLAEIIIPFSEQNENYEWSSTKI